MFSKTGFVDLNKHDERMLELHTVLEKCKEEKAAREHPQPLTLEQLRERIGKPVFMVGANPQKREWGIVHNGTDELGGRITLRLDFHRLITLPVNSKGRFYDHEPKEA